MTFPFYLMLLNVLTVYNSLHMISLKTMLYPEPIS